MRLCCLALLFCLWVPVAAHADTLNYSIAPAAGSFGTYTLSFSLPQNPATTQNSGDGFFSADTYVTGGGLDGLTTILFINTNVLNSAGDIQFILDSNNSVQVVFSGDILFSGDESAPTLLTGQFPLTGGVDGEAYALNAQSATVVPPVVPEPSSLLLLGTGAAWIAARRQFRRKR